jgi:hypothetical protein
MTIYITREGTKLTAEFPAELLEKLYQAEPVCTAMLQDIKNQVAAKSQSISQVEARATDPENCIANLIQNDYLSVIDPIDG